MNDSLEEFSPVSQWGIECVRQQNSDEAEGIEAALRAMKRIQAEESDGPPNHPA